jgi:hypothetical protein
VVFILLSCAKSVGVDDVCDNLNSYFG